MDEDQMRLLIDTTLEHCDAALHREFNRDEQDYKLMQDQIIEDFRQKLDYGLLS